MRNFTFLVLILFFLGWGCTYKEKEGPNTSEEFSVNGWIILSGDSSQIFNTLKEARKYDVNHIQFSHNLIMNIDDLLRDSPEASYRATVINKGTELAHSMGMKVYVWCHEFSVEDKSLKEICYSPDSPIWGQRKKAYTEGLKKIPEIDGVILMYGSSPIPPWRTTCNCDWCTAHGLTDLKSHSAQSKRIKILTEHIGSHITRDMNKELYVRTFVHEPEEIIWYTNGLSEVENVAFKTMHKSPIQDWQPYNPHNASIGSIPGKDFVVENDAAGEYLGVSVLPYCAPGYYLYRLNYMKEKGGTGTVTRVGIDERSVLNTPNFINLYAVGAFNKNPKVSLNEVWDGAIGELYKETVDKKAFPILKELFERTFFIRLKSNFVLGIWAYDKGSDFPKQLNTSQFSGRGDMPKWDKNWEFVWNSLDNPNIVTLKNVWQESTEAVESAYESLIIFPQLENLVSKSIYDDLYTRFVHQYLASKAWRAIDIYVWSSKALNNNKENQDSRKLLRWKTWAYAEMKNVLEEYKTNNLFDLPIMGYSSLKRYIQNIDSVEMIQPDNNNFKPEAPLFSSIKIAYNKKNRNTATISFNVKDDCSTRILWGEELPFPENSVIIQASSDKTNTLEINSLKPDKRYIVRIMAQGDDNLYSGDHWLFTF